MTFPDLKPKLVFEVIKIGEEEALTVEIVEAFSLSEAQELKKTDGIVIPSWGLTEKALNLCKPEAKLKEPSQMITVSSYAVITPVSTVRRLYPVQELMGDLKRLQQSDPPGLTYHLEWWKGELSLHREYPPKEVENMAYHHQLKAYQEEIRVINEWFEWVDHLKSLYVTAMIDYMNSRKVDIIEIEDPQLDLFGGSSGSGT